ncbi:MAG: GFA family protein [Amaricoccus sp.]|uniref:GFA family protein n=1 Tax=Amaricoccus sp. TaxID=1872485 RepID=UPI0039E2CD4E
MATEHHSGSCQCGAVAFEADVDISKPFTCNCSRCRRLGARLAFTPESAFTLLKGADSLAEYTFNKHVIRHQFCKVCGIEPFAFAPGRDGTPMAAINVNCLDGVDAAALPVQHFDGAAA